MQITATMQYCKTTELDDKKPRIKDVFLEVGERNISLTGNYISDHQIREAILAEEAKVADAKPAAASAPGGRNIYAVVGYYKQNARLKQPWTICVSAESPVFASAEAIHEIAAMHGGEELNNIYVTDVLLGRRCAMPMMTGDQAYALARGKGWK